jgi:hypothetical protein
MTHRRQTTARAFANRKSGSRLGFGARSTRVRGRRGYLLTRRLGVTTWYLLWSEDRRVYELGTGTPRTVSLRRLRNRTQETVRERLRDFPLEVEMVSRLRKPAEVKDAVKRFSEGKIDILIGTHRLLSRDVRAHDLGLLVIDEEQRFGVRQKELLRQLKLKVDVLSMSATPIPRTMQVSLAGLRDISVIETPPEGRRPIRTYVGPYDEQLVRTAIEREIGRGGQVLFLHNRIETLPETAEHLRALVRGARVVEAHGRMDERELERTFRRFGEERYARNTRVPSLATLTWVVSPVSRSCSKK